MEEFCRLKYGSKKIKKNRFAAKCSHRLWPILRVVCDFQNEHDWDRGGGFPNSYRSDGYFAVAAFADLLDGAIARAMKAESEFGGIFDCLADAISFGVAPSVIVLKSLSVFPGTKLSFLITTAAIIFSLCGVLRLVRFNVNALEAKSNAQLAQANKKHFTGLPIPAAAASAVSLNLFLFSDDFRSLMPLSQTTETWILSLALILLGYCMISRWKFPSIKTLEIRVASFRIVFFDSIGRRFNFFWNFTLFCFGIFSSFMGLCLYCLDIGCDSLNCRA